jgi:glyoxylase-like metal-dependent hydrolase (beta-lactamase superfamily II)
MAERVRTGQEIEFCSTMIQQELPSREGLRIRMPDLAIAGPATFDLGDVHCHLVPLPGDHGPDGMGVWVEEEDLLFVGDALSPDAYHGPVHYTRAGLAGHNAALAAVPAGRLLHSHGDDLERREDVLAELVEELARL